MSRIWLLLFGLLLLAACNSREDWSRANTGNEVMPQTNYGGGGAGY